MKEKNLQERSNKFTMEIDQLLEAEKKFEIQKMKTKSELESTREKIKDSGKRSTSIFNKHKSVKLNKSTGQLPSFNKKEEK